MSSPYEKLDAEPTQNACSAIMHFLDRERDAMRESLLVRDLVTKTGPLGDVADKLYGPAMLRALNRRPDTRASALRSSHEAATRSADVMIVTVIPVERRAAMMAFDISRDDYDDDKGTGRRYYPTTLHSTRTKRDLRIVLTSINKPLNVNAALAVTHMRTRYRVNTFFLVGIAAGRRGKVALGDVVVPEHVHYYPPGRRLPEELLPRPGYTEAERVLRTNLSYYDPEETGFHERYADLWARTELRLKPKRLPLSYHPEYHYENIVVASGEELIQDGRLTTLAKQDERIAAGDQESFGFGAALFGERWAIVRGISDWGQKRKPTDWQFFAALAAAYTLRDFLEQEYEAPQQVTF